jgi:hypothetical protein
VGGEDELLIGGDGGMSGVIGGLRLCGAFPDLVKLVLELGTGVGRERTGGDGGKGKVEERERGTR